MKFHTKSFNAEHLRALKLATQEEYDRALNDYLANNGVPQGHLVRITSELSPVAMFKYMLARFEDPTGRINDLSKDPLSGVAWHYLLMLEGHPVEVTGYNFRIDVVIHRDLGLEASPEELAKLIKADLAARRNQVMQALPRLRKWVTFLNPYSHLRDTASRMLARAEEIDAVLDKSRRHPSTVEELKWQLANHGTACALASELAGINLALRMIAPVMAETFVNLTLFKLLKDGYRGRDVHRANILERVGKLHQTCDGFASPVDIAAPQFVAFHQMMQNRNNLLHGNIRPEQQSEGEVVYTYQQPNGAIISLFQEWKSIYDRSIGSRLTAHPLASAKGDLAAAERFVEYLLACMQPAVAADFRRTIGFVNMQYDKRSQELAALFSDDLADSLPPELYFGMGGGPAPFIAE
jgi:hypothetical protein